MKKGWQSKYDSIVETYPLIESIEWGSAFKKDSALFTSIVADLLKAEGRGATPGKRPPLDRKAASDQLAKLSQSDYSEYDFQTALKILIGKRSVREIAAKAGLGKSYLYQLISGEKDPSFSAREQLAEVFGKKPEFFIEYRVGYIAYNILEFLEEEPETATNWFIKIKKANNKKIVVK
jgi:transcriptional regulator with XRE-family HTH domain